MNKEPRKYSDASGFRRALETRLQDISQKEGIDLTRIRREVAFDRLLARLFSESNAPWLLKGGYAMELRLRKARTTKDIDLSLPTTTPSELKKRVLEMLQNSASKNLDDYFVFTIGTAMKGLDAAPEGGERYPVTASVAGRVFAKFHLDVGIGDAAIQPTEVLEGKDWLGFAGISAIKIISISKEQQFAEKLHAYTLPRTERLNSRVKDVVDMALLIRLGTLDKERLIESIHKTFDQRNTHKLPSQLPEPPPNWETPYEELSKECGLPWSLQEAIQIIGSYITKLI